MHAKKNISDVSDAKNNLGDHIPKGAKKKKP
jgi:hypothetical protein